MKLKTIIPVLLIIFNSTFLFAQTAKITSASMNNNTIQITYSITGATESQSFDMELWYSIDGAAFKKCFSISNNEGTLLKIKAGIGKQLTWNVLTDLPRLEANTLDFELRLVATSSNSNYTESSSGVNIDMVFIKGGTFMMGSPSSEVNRGDDEYQHSVTLSDFYMGKYEVTYEQYDAFCNSTGRSKPSDNGWGRGSRPVTNVSWNDAVAYCEWFSKKSGKTYRLPTEAEWEYACRAVASSASATSTPFNTGNCLNSSQANYRWDNPYNRCSNSNTTPLIKTMPVGSYSPNTWGLYDMHGNVWEWCSDWYSADYYKSSPQNNPKGPTTAQSYRVLRGGSWYYYAQRCRSAYRSNYTPDNRNYCMGFRLVSPQ